MRITPSMVPMAYCLLSERSASSRQTKRPWPDFLAAIRLRCLEPHGSIVCAPRGGLENSQSVPACFRDCRKSRHGSGLPPSAKRPPLGDRSRRQNPQYCRRHTLSGLHAPTYIRSLSFSRGVFSIDVQRPLSFFLSWYRFFSLGIVFALIVNQAMPWSRAMFASADDE